MSRGVVTVPPNVEIYEAAKIMAVQEVKRLPVVDEDNRLLGVISRSDIVSIYTRPDDVIEDEIREDLIRRVLFIDPDGVQVGVANGVVTLSGQVATRSEASMLEELTNRLDGVLRVESKLTWTEGD
jgi:CBS-domain-containing membrane protein